MRRDRPAMVEAPRGVLPSRAVPDCGETYCEVQVPSPVIAPPAVRFDRAAVIVLVFLGLWLAALLIFELTAPRRVSQVTQRLSRAWKWFGAALITGLALLGWHLVAGGPFWLVA